MFLDTRELPVRNTYAWQGHFTTSAIKGLHFGDLAIPIEGEMTLLFQECDLDGMASIEMVDDRISVPPVDLTRERGPLRLREALSLPEFAVHIRDEDIAESEGYVDLDSGHFSLRFTAELTIDRLSVLARLHVPRLWVTLQESGVLDAENRATTIAGRLSVARSPHELPLAHSGRPDGVMLLGYFSKGCATWVDFAGSVDGSKPTTSETLYIVEGDDVHLWWESSEDVSSVEIEPSVGQQGPSGTFVVGGLRQDTTFELTTQGGECERKAKVEVRLVRSGDEIPLQAPYIETFERFRYVFHPQFCSQSIRIRSITPKCGSGCYTHWYKQGNYLKCGATYCVGQWSGWWTSPTGGLPTPFAVAIMENPLSDLPIVGTWDFMPTVISGALENTYAYFDLKVS